MKNLKYKKLANLNELFSKHLFLSSLIAGLLFISIVIGSMHYADILMYNFQPGHAGQLVGLGRHQPIYQSLINYDSTHYLKIAQTGYKVLDDAAFLPLFPLLIRLLAHLKLSYDMAALLAAWIPLLAAIPVIFKWAELELQERNIKLSPWMTLFFIAIFPTA